MNILNVIECFILIWLVTRIRGNRRLYKHFLAFNSLYFILHYKIVQSKVML